MFPNSRQVLIDFQNRISTSIRFAVHDAGTIDHTSESFRRRPQPLVKPSNISMSKNISTPGISRSIPTPCRIKSTIAGTVGTYLAFISSRILISHFPRSWVTTLPGYQIHLYPFGNTVPDRTAVHSTSSITTPQLLRVRRFDVNHSLRHKVVVVSLKRQASSSQLPTINSNTTHIHS